jgi:hypothetical protein
MEMMGWTSILGWLGVFLMGCYAGSKYELSRMRAAASRGLLIFVGEEAFRVQKALPPK